jgi:hypothetical protein
MNNFCVDLNLPISPLRSDIDVNSFPITPWQLLSLDLINPDIKNLFKSLNLNLQVAALFVLTENSSGSIHVDGINISDVSKINWVVGSDHMMNWFQIKNPITQKLVDTKISDNDNIPSRNYISYTHDEVELVHSHSVGYPSIIQAGIPHNVTNLSGIRRCISIALFDRFRRPLTIAQASRVFAQYI